MSRREAILLGAAVCLAAAAEAADAGRREKPVALPAIGATTLVAVPLDADVHAATAVGYGDLRILDAANVEVPHVFRDTPTPGPLVEARVRTAREPDGRATRITVDTRREPVTELTIATDARNFSRQVIVEQPVPYDRDGQRHRGRPLATATITRIDVAGIRGEELTIPIPESRLPTYDVVIDDGDSPPITVTGVSARGPAREVVFLAEPAGGYRLAYGGGLAAPRYDTAAIRAALAARAVAMPATLGPETAIAMPPPAAEPFRLLADGRFQIAVIAALAALLAVALFRATKRLDAQSPPSAE